MATLDVYWYDDLLDINWFARADSARAFRLVTSVVAAFGDYAISAELGPEWAPHSLRFRGVEPIGAAARIDRLFAEETQFDGVIESADHRFTFRSHSGEGGGYAALESSENLFGADLDRIADLLRQFAQRENISMLTPLQTWLFGEITPQ